MTDQNELDELLADAGTPADAPANEPEQGQQRDANGRFAAQAADEPTTPPDPVDPIAPPANEPEPNGTVPQKALHEARQREREARESYAELQRQNQQLISQVQAMLAQQQRPQQPQQPQQPQKQQDWWDNPANFVDQRVNAASQQMHQALMYNARLTAGAAYGRETVEAAVKAFDTALQTGAIDQVDAYRVMNSPNPFEAGVQWHKRQQTLQRVGEDPDAWLNAEIEKRLSDPAEQAKILERLRGVAAGNVNRSQPQTQLPPSLSRLPGGSNPAGGGDLSDAALFSHAMGS